MAMEQNEDKNRKVAWVVSITLHVLLLLAFIFMVAWREPNPPHPEYGIEVNFGTSTTGSGEIQPEPEEAINESESEEDAQPEETSVEEVVEEIVEQIVESQESIPVTQESEVITQPNESPALIEEKKEKVDNPVKEEPKEQVIEKPIIKEKPQEVKNPVVFKKKDGAEGDKGESSTPKNANHGDDVNATGDKGNEEGTLDARTLYGDKGGGGGAPALNISGWYWDEAPNKKDASNENGLVEFSFEVDNEGYVGNIKVIKSTVSPSVANFYKDQLQKVTFSQTNPNATPLPRTKGTITFIIKSR